MTESFSGDKVPFFHLDPQDLAKWLDEFERATVCRVTPEHDGFSSAVDLKALNKMLAAGGENLNCLNPVDAEKCAGWIGKLQQDVATILAGGMTAFHEPSAERREQSLELASKIEAVTPYFRWLGYRARGELADSVKTNNGENLPLKDSNADKDRSDVTLPPTVPSRAESSGTPSPSADAITCYRVHFFTGKPQTEVAEKLTHELKRPITQGQVSKWLKQVTKWIEAGNVLPGFAKPTAGESQAMDPSILNMGKRQDQRTKRQRNRKSVDSDN